jgi:hypothetical protein
MQLLHWVQARSNIHLAQEKKHARCNGASFKAAGVWESVDKKAYGF